MMTAVAFMTVIWIEGVYRSAKYYSFSRFAIIVEIECHN
jgi:hypothetical protein